MKIFLFSQVFVYASVRFLPGFYPKKISKSESISLSEIIAKDFSLK